MTAAINGNMPGDGKLFIVYGGLIGGGWGAKYGADGSNATICINDGDTHNSPLEQVEAKYPMVVERYGLREDSGGAGRWQGGMGTEKKVRATSEWMFNAQVERVYCRPWGLVGGHPGAGNSVGVQVGDDKELRFPSGKVLGRLLKPGDAYILRSGGGGGYGSPLDRPLEIVETDLIEGYISGQKAQACYGIVFEGASEKIDRPATEAKRAKLRTLSGAIAERDNEDPLAEEAALLEQGNEQSKGLYFTEGMLFPLRCC